jgi:hypothetical protein
MGTTAQRSDCSGTAIFVPQAHISAATAGWGSVPQKLGHKALQGPGPPIATSPRC